MSPVYTILHIRILLASEKYKSMKLEINKFKKYMHSTVAYFFSEILIFTEKVSLLSNIFVRSSFCYDKLL